MGKRCPACRRPVSEDAVLCTNCGYDRRTRGRVLLRPDGPVEFPGPRPFAWAYSPAAVGLALLTAWGFFFTAAAKDPATAQAYRVAVFTVGGAALVVMVLGLLRSGMDWEEWFLFLYHPEMYLLRGEFDGYCQMVLMTSIVAAGGLPFLALSRLQAGGVGP